MWEKDRRLLNAFRECYSNLITSIEAGEDVELGGACVEETEALTAYTIATIGYYKTKNSTAIPEKKQKYF